MELSLALQANSQCPQLLGQPFAAGGAPSLVEGQNIFQVIANLAGTSTGDQVQKGREAFRQLGEHMTVAGGITGQVVVGAAAHADKIILPQSLAGIAFGKQSPDKERLVAQLAQNQAAFMVGGRFVGVLVE